MKLDRLVDRAFRRKWPSNAATTPLSEEDIRMMINRSFYLSILREGWQQQLVSTIANKKIQDIRGAMIEMESLYALESEAHLLAAPIVGAQFEDGSNIDETIPHNQSSADYLFILSEVDVTGAQPRFIGRVWQYYPATHTLSAQYEQPLIITLRDLPKFKLGDSIDSFRFERSVSLQHPLLLLHRYSAYRHSRSAT